jgi:hypothetical protein
MVVFLPLAVRELRHARLELSQLELQPDEPDGQGDRPDAAEGP